MNRIVKVISLLLATAAAIFFVVHAHRAVAKQDLSALLDGRVLLAMVLLTALYAASIVTTAAAWSWQLRAMGQPHRYGRFLAILAATQFGKYLPGNIGQHVGRVALACGEGVTLPAALLTAGYELLLALVASAHIAAVTVLFAPPDEFLQVGLLQHKWLLLALVSGGAVAGLVVAPSAASWLIRLRSPGTTVEATGLRLDLKTVIASYAMYVSSLTMIGLGVWGMAHAIADDGIQVPGAFFFVGAFATSWVAGFVVPGAPAGLGVREVVLAAWLSDRLPPATVVVVIVALRIATTVGDAVNFAWGSALVVRHNRSSGNAAS